MNTCSTIAHKSTNNLGVTDTINITVINAFNNISGPAAKAHYQYQHGLDQSKGNITRNPDKLIRKHTVTKITPATMS